MIFKELIKKSKEAYKIVNIKKITTKKHYELYHLQLKNKRTINKILIIKKLKVIKEFNIAIKDIKEVEYFFKKNIEEFIKKGFVSKDDSKKNNNNVSGIEAKYNIYKEINKDLKQDYKSEKELKDYSFLLLTSSFILDYLFSHNVLSKEDRKVLKKMDANEKIIYEFYLYAQTKLDYSNKNLIKLKEYADEILDYVYKRYNFDIEHYPVLVALYLLEFWRTDVVNKKIDIQFNYNKIYKLLKDLEEDLYKNNCEVYRENSQKIAYDITEKLYNTRRMTKQEIKEFFKKVKNAN